MRRGLLGRPFRSYRVSCIASSTTQHRTVLLTAGEQEKVVPLQRRVRRSVDRAESDVERALYIVAPDQQSVVEHLPKLLRSLVWDKSSRSRSRKKWGGGEGQRGDVLTI